ncbi:protein of unknown function DUF81 [Methanothermus fervidus DSM 2088]|uniref:Probable membrane transporter protein n=1 Tax=Methanothermus fervidus (strain ATCC 43054 / DSM 2088 / JCM 10308 / V24 S) TaxID=523846 RepID=E3GY84_METFV|nr:sulfite exporter TauE/SafE family protein [Methanothermus fervidus]ADP77266.1 protein of unknown function DUF81 [Methanothermus fervidus DSM 2088]
MSIDILGYIIILIITGIGVGTLTGMLGVGGGFILVPIFFFLNQIFLGVNESFAFRMATATSLSTFIPNMVSAYEHAQRGSVLWKEGTLIAFFGFIGGIIGATINLILPVKFLKIFFALLLVFLAIKLIRNVNPKTLTFQKNVFLNNISYLIPIGILTGILSGMFGIGGGIILVPLLTIIGFDLLKSIGTSTFVVTITSLGGILIYIFSTNAQNLSYSIGYVNLLQSLIINITGVLSVRFGVKMAYKYPKKVLKYVVAILLIIFAIKLQF